MQLDAIFEGYKNKSQLFPYPSLVTRKETLKQLKKALQENADELAMAVSQDFSHRSKEETLLLEIFPVINAIDYCLGHCKSWMAERKRKVSWLFKPAYAYLLPQPLGVVGIVAPWNYPLFLALVPAVYALAAGNRVMIKMSELTPQTAKLLNDLIQKMKLNDYLFIMDGDVEVAKKFVSLPFGHILFTGTTEVGKKVMKAASENLTSVTLELGGKSAAILSHSMRMDYLKRLFMGKLFNAGQTCVAPDYLMVPKGWENKITVLFSQLIDEYYPKLMANDDYSAIISNDHKDRLLDLIEDAKLKGADIEQFGDLKAKGRKIPFYLVFNLNENMRLMQEEIFGPILPVVTYDDFDEALAYINAKPNPLALYYFGEDKREMKKLRRGTLSGALIINDTLMHVAIDDLPFGGVGYSGMGCYHGQEGFDSFSKLKPVFVQRKFSSATWFYPPYGKFLKIFLQKFVGIGNNPTKQERE